MKRFLLLSLTATLSIGLLYADNGVAQSRKPAKSVKKKTIKKPAAKPGKKVTQSAGAPAAGTPDVIKKDIKLGTGAEATRGKTVAINYTGWLYSNARSDHHGALIDSSHSSGAPFKFTIGQGKVIKGWETGVEGMKVGGQRALTIPGGLGYTTRTLNGVAVLPDSPLIYDIQLVGVQ